MRPRKRLDSFVRALPDSPARVPLAAAGALTALCLLASALGMVLDPRVIAGQPAWLKPAKFALSISIYTFTLLWLLSFVRAHARLVRTVAWTTAVGLLLEQALIVTQVIRGTTSHFNESTPLNATIFNVMGTTIVVVWAMGALTTVLLLRQHLSDAAFATSLRLGLAIALVGMALAFLMTSANPAQRAAAVARAQAKGTPVLVSGAHTVGVPAGDGGPGIPVVGWSTEGGDLRVPHFVGIHAVNVLPFVGWALGRLRSARLTPGHRVALVWAIGLGYLGFTLLLAWQALRGQSVAAPDAPTLLAGLGLAACVALASATVVVHARRGISARTAAASR